MWSRNQPCVHYWSQNGPSARSRDRLVTIKNTRCQDSEGQAIAVDACREDLEEQVVVVEACWNSKWQAIIVDAYWDLEGQAVAANTCWNLKEQAIIVNACWEHTVTCRTKHALNPTLITSTYKMAPCDFTNMSRVSEKYILANNLSCLANQSKSDEQNANC